MSGAAARNPQAAGGAAGSVALGRPADEPVGAPAAGTTPAGDRPAGRFGRPRILVVGCGDVGLRLVRLLGGRFRVHAATHTPARLAVLRAAGATPHLVDLDDAATLARIGALAPTVVHLAPPPSHGRTDPRTAALCRALRGVRRFVYISTSGVYGDCGGARIDETRTVAPMSDRAWRRVDAERRLRVWARTTDVRLSILRVPGIYAGDRLPLARLRAATPVLESSVDVFTNHVHADDLARLIVAAIARGAPQRIYHAVDDSEIRMGDWMDLVADAHRLPRPERVARDALAARVSPASLSFMRESRRLSGDRARFELGVRLAYPTVRDGLAARPGPIAGEAAVARTTE